MRKISDERKAEFKQALWPRLAAALEGTTFVEMTCGGSMILFSSNLEILGTDSIERLLTVDEYYTNEFDEIIDRAYYAARDGSNIDEVRDLYWSKL